MAKKAKNIISTDAWRVVEKGLHKEENRVAESLFSIANEYSGVRGYIDEGSSLDSLQGSYFNGIYELAEKENFQAYKGIIKRGHFMVNAVDYLKMEIYVDGHRVDIGKDDISDFERVLDMRSGIFSRKYTLHCQNNRIKLCFERFLDMEKCERAYRRIRFESDEPAEIELKIYLDFGTKHWGKEGRWQDICAREIDGGMYISARTATTRQSVATASVLKFDSPAKMAFCKGDKCAFEDVRFMLDGKQTLTQYIFNVASKRALSEEENFKRATEGVRAQFELGYDAAATRLERYWENFWKRADIVIEGDERDGQGIRYCIFQLQQTYHGYDPQNNIGAKGLTGEAYSGHAFWDTETYCLPYYLFNNIKAARDLLMFRYNTLPNAKKRAEELDCKGACYPIATLNGNEACDLWQHASLQFQPSTGVAYGIRHYMLLSGDMEFLRDFGLEMLLEICKFLMSRGDFNHDRTKFGFYAVMGPDEFQMMVNHNCYTNFMAKKTFEFAFEAMEQVGAKYPESLLATRKKVGFSDEDVALMRECMEKTYILYDPKTLLFEQHQNYFDLPHIDVGSIPVTDFPLYSHWSYDRIYRNDMIKQPDVLMFMFLFSGDFTLEQKRANFEFYEPRCIHESSLSPSVHSILAAEIGKSRMASDFFGFATRLDLDDYNRNTCEGLHTTSIAAAWLNVVYGFGGLRSDREVLSLAPSIPERWSGYSFKIDYRGSLITVRVTHEGVTLDADKPVEIALYGQKVRLEGKISLVCAL